MGDHHDLINEIYLSREKYSFTVTTFSKSSVFVAASLIILFKFLFYVFSPILKFGMDPQIRVNFSILSKAFQNHALFAVWYLFPNKVAEIRVEYLGRQFLDPFSSPMKSVSGGSYWRPWLFK